MLKKYIIKLTNNTLKDIKLSKLQDEVNTLKKENNLLKEELLYLRRNLNL